MDYGHPVRKLPSLHSQKSNPNPKFLGTVEAYFVCQIGAKFKIFFDLCLHWVSMVRALKHRICTLCDRNCAESAAQMPQIISSGFDGYP